MREDDDAAVPYCASLGDAGKVVRQRILFCVDDDPENSTKTIEVFRTGVQPWL